MPKALILRQKNAEPLPNKLVRIIGEANSSETVMKELAADAKARKKEEIIAALKAIDLSFSYFLYTTPNSLRIFF